MNEEPRRHWYKVRLSTMFLLVVIASLLVDEGRLRNQLNGLWVATASVSAMDDSSGAYRAHKHQAQAGLLVWQ